MLKQLSSLVIKSTFWLLLCCEISCLKLYIHFPHIIFFCFVGRSKQAKKKRRKEVLKSPEKREQNHQDDIHIISSGDDDCSHGIKSMNFFFLRRITITLYLLKTTNNVHKFNDMNIYFCNVSIVTYCEVSFTCTLEQFTMVIAIHIHYSNG